MNENLLNIGLFVGGELLAIPIFYLVTRMFKRDLTVSSVLRGVLERGFLFIVLLIDLPSGLAFFGALKIATRLKDDDKISNDYFLTGNLISVLLVIAYYWISQNY